MIPVLQCLLGGFVEYSDFVTIYYRDVAAFEMVRLVDLRIEAPIIILKVSKALANTDAFELFVFISFGIAGPTVAALFAIWIRTRLMVWQLEMS